MSDEQNLPWMKLWVPDFIGKTVMWAGVARGLYAQCLILEWASGPLPDDAAELASILRYDPAIFATAWVTVRPAFELTADGRLINRALEAERAEAYELRTKLSKGGKSGAKGRWKGKQCNSKANDQANGSPNDQANDRAYAHQHHVQHQHSAAKSQAREDGDARGNAPANAAKEPNLSQSETSNFPLFQLSKEEVNRWREVRAAYPTEARHKNADWGKASRYACRLVGSNRATWPSLRISTRKYADYCASTQLEPMSVVDFFGSSDEHWLIDWHSVPPAPAEKDARVSH